MVKCNRRPFPWLPTIVIVITCAYAVPGAQAQSSPDPIVIASMDFTESRLLAEIMAQLIREQTSIPVERTNLKGVAAVFAAMSNGDADLYADYTGTAWKRHLKIEDPVRDPLQAYVVVAERMKEEFEMCWLMPFGFENSFELGMPESLARKLNVRRISDLEHHQHVRVAISPFFSESADGFPGLCAAYQLNFDNVRVIERGLIYEALAEGKVDLIDTWTTDGKVARFSIRILEDDKGFFPPYHAAPVIREETLRRHAEIKEVLNQLAFRIDNLKMQELNRRVEEGESVEDVARSFLQSEKLAGGSQTRKTRSRNFFLFFAAKSWTIFRFTLEHLALTGTALLLAILIAVPTGILLTRRPKAAPMVLGVAGVLQTIPSLALLVLMIPLLGLGTKPAVAALFLYSLLPIIRNTYTGIKEVDEHLLEAARGIGMHDSEILWRVELPLATRTIMAGIRTATVIGIGLTTLAAFVGAGGLGVPISNGLTLNDQNWILCGAIPAALLALLADFLLGRAEHWFLPKGVGEG